MPVAHGRVRQWAAVMRRVKGGAVGGVVDVRPGMDLYDDRGRYIGLVTKVYPVPERFTPPSGAPFGCFKARRGPLPFVGPKPLLVPFDAVVAVDAERGTVTVNASRKDADRWVMGRSSAD